MPPLYTRTASAQLLLDLAGGVGASAVEDEVVEQVAVIFQPIRVRQTDWSCRRWWVET